MSEEKEYSKRVFKYDGKVYEDPAPDMTPEEIKKAWQPMFPELANATIEEETDDEGTLTVTFVKRAGTKGAHNRRLCVKILDLRSESGRYYFRIGDGNDFEGAVKALKAQFGPGERNWNPETLEWDVPATEYSEKKLAKIFPNAEACFTILRSQLRMF